MNNIKMSKNCSVNYKPLLLNAAGIVQVALEPGAMLPTAK